MFQDDERPGCHNEEHRTREFLLGQDETKTREETFSYQYKATYPHTDIHLKITNRGKIDEATETNDDEERKCPE